MLVSEFFFCQTISGTLFNSCFVIFFLINVKKITLWSTNVIQKIGCGVWRSEYHTGVTVRGGGGGGRFALSILREQSRHQQGQQKRQRPLLILLLLLLLIYSGFHISSTCNLSTKKKGLELFRIKQAVCASVRIRQELRTSGNFLYIIILAVLPHTVYFFLFYQKNFMWLPDSDFFLFYIQRSSVFFRAAYDFGV